jgi:predicted  nucleic acid-binding Zn-ribbon protein
MSNNIQKKIDLLDDKSFDLECVIRNVNDETSAILYNDVPMNIYIKIQSLAEENGIDAQELEWKIDEVREAVNKLESTIYSLVEPFEDKKRDLDNEKDELEWEVDWIRSSAG